MPTETRYAVNPELAQAKFATGPVNMLSMGDSISAMTSPRNLFYGIWRSWKVPNGWSGFFMPRSGASAEALNNFDGTQAVAYSLPFANFSPANGSNVTATTGSDNDFATSGDQPLSGTDNPLPLKWYKKAFTGVNTAYETFATMFTGARGISQFGEVCKAGDWITGKATDAIKVKLLHLGHANAVTAGMAINVKEGQGAVTGTNVDYSITPTTTPGLEWVTASLPSTQVDQDNAPGLTAAPLAVQYEGYGTVVPGTQMSSTYLVAASNCNHTGCLQINHYKTTATDLTGKSHVHYGYSLEDSTNTTGFYYDSASVSGYTTQSHIDNYTDTQLANKLKVRGTSAALATNVVFMHIGENHTTAQWNGGSYSESLIRDGIMNMIAKVYRCAALAGIAQPLIILSSPWRTVGGTKSGSGWYPSVSSIMRGIARANQNIVFVDTYQWFADYFTTTEMYSATGNAFKGMLYDGVHPSYRGCVEWGRFLWQTMYGSGVPIISSPRSDRRGVRS